MTEDQIRTLKLDGGLLPDEYLIELGRITSLSTVGVTTRYLLLGRAAALGAATRRGWR